MYQTVVGTKILLKNKEKLFGNCRIKKDFTIFCRNRKYLKDEYSLVLRGGIINKWMSAIL